MDRSRHLDRHTNFQILPTIHETFSLSIDTNNKDTEMSLHSNVINDSKNKNDSYDTQKETKLSEFTSNQNKSKTLRKKVSFPKEIIDDHNLRYNGNYSTPSKYIPNYILSGTLTFDKNDSPNSIQTTLKSILQEHRCKQNLISQSVHENQKLPEILLNNKIPE